MRRAEGGGERHLLQALRAELGELADRRRRLPLRELRKQQESGVAFDESQRRVGAMAIRPRKP